MEAAGKQQNRKRTRDDEVEGDDNHRGKKQESSYNSYNEQRRYEFHDGIGVFDFPWLKDDAAIFNSEVDVEEDKFAPCNSYLDENFNIESPQNYDLDDDDDHSLGSLVVDDLEAVDCIWSCVIDHPLDLGFNKGYR